MEEGKSLIKTMDSICIKQTTLIIVLNEQYIFIEVTCFVNIKATPTFT